MCVAVDSNSLFEMQVERISEEFGRATAAFNQIMEQSYIALDAEGLCKQEWLECMPGPYGEEVRNWIDSLIVSGKIRLIDMPSCEHFVNACRAGGLPKKDIKWAKLCAHDCIKYLLTEDIDFFDPSAKSGTSKAKERIKRDLGGRMRKIIKKATGTDVICFQHVEQFDLG